MDKYCKAVGFIVDLWLTALQLIQAAVWIVGWAERNRIAVGVDA
jgi:hypothetical protein